VNRLFIELYLDEDVDILIANLIRARGFSVLTTREAGNLRVDDEAQLADAISYGRPIVTHNRVDFERLHNAYVLSGQHHHGIIVATRRPPHELAQRLLTERGFSPSGEAPAGLSQKSPPLACSRDSTASSLRKVL
jgi:hypothetical protein